MLPEKYSRNSVKRVETNISLSFKFQAYGEMLRRYLLIESVANKCVTLALIYIMMMYWVEAKHNCDWQTYYERILGTDWKLTALFGTYPIPSLSDTDKVFIVSSTAKHCLIHLMNVHLGSEWLWVSEYWPMVIMTNNPETAFKHRILKWNTAQTKWS